jgi:tellurite resistance protein TehA-like permease
VRTFSPVLRIGSMTIVLGLGVLALIALIAGFNVKLAREGGRSIQASTGMFYLAVILAPAAEFAAKVRFF